MTHDYALSADELFAKCGDLNSKVQALKNTDPDVAISSLEKAVYYANLGTLKHKFNHPYDSKIYNAEEFAMKGNFMDANSILLGLVLEYNMKGR